LTEEIQLYLQSTSIRPITMSSGVYSSL